MRNVRQTMRLNPATVMADKARRDAEVKPLPVIKFKSKVESRKLKVTSEPAPAELSTLNFELSTPHDKPELTALWQEMAQVKKQRDMLSTRTVPLINKLEQELQQQGATIAEEFMNGRLPMPELAAHYAAIQSHTDQAKAIYDKIVHVQQYGKLPEQSTAESRLSTVDSGPESNEASAIKYEIRRLDDVIYKTNKKIAQSKGGLKGPRNTDRVLEWQTKVSLAIISRDDLKVKLKRMRV